MSDQIRQTSRRWFEKAWNERCTESACAMTTADALAHSEAGEMVGMDAFLAFRDRFLDAFPDLKFEVESVIADGDEAAVRWVARGTHTGDALGFPPCGETIEIRGMSWHRYRDGLMIEGWDAWNMGGMMARLQEATKARESGS